MWPHCKWLRARGSEFGLSGFSSGFSSLITDKLSHLSCLSFLTCKRGIIILPCGVTESIKWTCLWNLVQIHGTYVLNNLFYYEVSTQSIVWAVTNPSIHTQDVKPENEVPCLLNVGIGREGGVRVVVNARVRFHLKWAQPHPQWACCQTSPFSQCPQGHLEDICDPQRGHMKTLAWKYAEVSKGSGPIQWDIVHHRGKSGTFMQHLVYLPSRLNWEFCNQEWLPENGTFHFPPSLSMKSFSKCDVGEWVEERSLFWTFLTGEKKDKVCLTLDETNLSRTSGQIAM